LFLEKAGFSVLSATGSSEALKICKNHTGLIDLLITDLLLPPSEFSFASGENEFPHVHGHELALRALRMKKNLRVILMSADVEKDLRGYGLRQGLIPCVQKPFSEETLIALVNQTLLSSPPALDSFLKESTGSQKSGDAWFD
jgi:CheY-like chemotaxis protein